MEKDYVKDTYKALAFFVSIGVLYLAVWVYAMFISEDVYHPFIVNVGYILAGGTMGLLLGCLYGWFYLKEKPMAILAGVFTLAVSLYYSFGLFLIKPLVVDNAYPLGLAFVIILFAVTSFIFRSAIKDGRKYEQLWQKITKSNEELKKDFENRLPDIVKNSLSKLIEQQVRERLERKAEKPNPPLE